MRKYRNITSKYSLS